MMRDSQISGPRISRFTRAVKPVAFIVTTWLLLMISSAFGQSPLGRPAPEVHLDADGLTPRPIEELTGTSIAHHYSLAWNDMAEALEFNRVDGLGEDFVGFAKDRLVKRIADQQQTGVHVRIVDHGHHLKAVFYSTDGTAMQLVDQAQLEIQTYDGNKLLDTQSAPHEYMVLMTPGADRWYIRDLQEISAKTN